MPLHRYGQSCYNTDAMLKSLHSLYITPLWASCIVVAVYAIARAAHLQRTLAPAQRRDLPTSRQMTVIMIVIVILGLYGARLARFIMEPGSILSLSDFFILTRGGFVSWGSFAGIFLAAMITTRLMRLSLPKTLDIVALALPPHIITRRIGCLLDGCCYGTPTDSFLAVFSHGAWRHPFPLYIIVLCLVIYIALMRAASRRPAPGTLMTRFFLWYTCGRFFLEYFRQEPALPGFPWLTLPQLVCLLFLPLVVYLHLHLERIPCRTP
jgi:phosphatidylglycerol:prolipoprotein diacylglycerol transferase